MMMKKFTERIYESLDSYLSGVGRYPLLSAQEETELFGRIKEGDEEALECVITSNLRFAVSISRKYQRRGKSFEELLVAANDGLEAAAREFEPESGLKFITYAVERINQSLIALVGEVSD